MSENAVTHITPELSVGALVDDMMAAGRKDFVEKVGKNLRSTEKEKKYTFSTANGKSHYMIINTGKKQAEQKLNLLVEKGNITRTREYKYLGNWITEDGKIKKIIRRDRNKIKMYGNRNEKNRR